MDYRRSIGTEAAIALAISGWWKVKTHRQVAQFQLFTEELSMPFEVFHEALKKALGRPVWTHELGLNYDGIVKEFLGQADPPTMAEILELIPADKRIILVKEE